MDKHDDSLKMDFWVVHVDIKIWGTVVWEGVFTGFKDNAEALEWQRNFMKHAPQECSTSLIQTDKAPPPAEIAEHLKKEIEQFLTETMEEKYGPTPALRERG